MSTCPEPEGLLACADGNGSDADLRHIEECEGCTCALAAAVKAIPNGARTTSADPWLHVDEVAEGLSGVVAGRYELERLVGQGGMGSVYQALDSRLRRPVALKVLRGHDRRRNPASRLWTESRVMARLRHPNVVAVYDVGEHEGLTYIAMEFVQGTTLGRWARGRPWAEVLQKYLEAAQGIVAAHAQGIVHRDFKPDNVLIDESGRALVGDFGLACKTVADEVATDGRTRDDESIGGLCGTPAYMAPEQLQSGSVDERTDLYAFCLCLWEALCGRRPFDGVSAAALIEQMRCGPRWPTHGPRVPRPIRRALRQGLAFDPASRPVSMEKLVARLRSRSTLRPALALGLGAVALAGLPAVAAPAKLKVGCATSDPGSLWGPDDRAQLEAAFESTGLEHPSAELSQQLAMYAATWNERRQEACVANGDDSPAAAARQEAIAACLRDARIEFEAVVDYAATAPLAEASSRVERALMFVPALPSVASCDQPGDAPLPSGDAMTAHVRQARDVLVSARALRSIGELTQSQELVDQLSDHPARQFGPLEAELVLARAHTSAASGSRREAEDLLREAARAGLASGHQAVAVRAWVALARLAAAQGESDRRHLEYFAYAQAALDRLGASPTLEVHYRLAFAKTAAARGELEVASDLLSTVIDDSSEEDPAHHGALHTLANIQAERGDAAEALASHLRLLELRVTKFGSRSIPAARSHLGLGSTYARLGQWRESAEHALGAAQILEDVLGPDHSWLRIPLHNRADAMRRFAPPTETLAVQRRALALARLHTGFRSTDVAKTSRSLALLLVESGQVSEALEVIDEACEILDEAHGRHHLETLRCTVDHAVVLRQAAAVELGVETASRAVEGYLRLLGPGAEPLARALTVRGQLYQLGKDIPRATRDLRRAIEIYETTDGDPYWPRTAQEALTEMAVVIRPSARASSPDPTTAAPRHKG